MLNLRVAFSLDEGYVPPQGTVRLLKPSRYFAELGFWKVDADTDDGVPQALQWRLQSNEGGLVVGGQTLLPEGPVYFNALCREDSRCGWQLADGRVTVKEDIGVNAGIFNARGILAEFKIVGIFGVSQARE